MKKGERGTGRVIDGDALEMQQANLLASAMVGQVSLATSLVGRTISYVRVHENVGHDRTAIVLEFNDGTTVRITGSEIQVQDDRDLPTTQENLLTPSHDIELDAVEEQ